MERLQTIWHWWNRFGSDAGGAVAPFMVMAAAFLLLLIGGGVDFALAWKARFQLQSALDTVALGVAGKGDVDVYVYADRELQRASAALGLTLEARTISATAESLTITAKVFVPTHFLGLVGHQRLTVSGSASSRWVNRSVWVALVMDSSERMGASGKMTAAKTVGKKIVSVLSKFSTSTEEAYVSLVPFNRFINLDRTKNSYFFLDFSNVKQWYGPVADLREDLDVAGKWIYYDGMPAADRHPADNSSFSGVLLTYVQRLTNNWASVSAAIDSLSPRGSTNQPIGITWGRYSLSTEEIPLRERTMVAGRTYHRIIVLISDGVNTQSRFYGNGVDWSPQIDARQALLCQNTKNAGYIIYAIQVNTDGAPPSSVMKNCASGPANFMMVTETAKLEQFYALLSRSIVDVRLSK